MKSSALFLFTYLWLWLVYSTSGVGQSIIALTRLTPGASDVAFTSIDVTTGKSTVISPMATSLFGGMGSVGQTFFGTLVTGTEAKLHRIDIHANTSEVVGVMANSTFSGFDIMSNGAAFAVSRNVSNPQLYSVDLTTGGTTPVGAPSSLQDAFVQLGGRAPTVLGLGSVGSKLYAVDNTGSQRSLMEIDPATGEARIVGGQLGLLASGTLSNGVARSRYSAIGPALTGFDTDGDGDFDQLFGAVNSFDDDNDPATPTVSIGGLGVFDTTTGLWELIGTNPGQAHGSMAFLPVPEPASIGSVGIALGFVIGWLRRTQRA